MVGYHLEGPKPARMYEVILPKKLGYFGKVQEVLEDLFRESAIRQIPFVRQSIELRGARTRASTTSRGSRRWAWPAGVTRFMRWTAGSCRPLDRSTNGFW